MKRIVEIVLTVCYLGYIPIAPGTIGSVPGLILSIFLAGEPIITSIIIIFSFVIGGFFCKRGEILFGDKDSSRIVFDEFLGMIITFYSPFGLIQMNIWTIVVGFCLFRAFDIWKPFPIRRLEAVPNGWGVMLDDVMAGIYANLCLSVLSIFLA